MSSHDDVARVQQEQRDREQWEGERAEAVRQAEAQRLVTRRLEQEQNETR